MWEDVERQENFPVSAGFKLTTHAGFELTTHAGFELTTHGLSV